VTIELLEDKKEQTRIQKSVDELRSNSTATVFVCDDKVNYIVAKK